MKKIELEEIPEATTETSFTERAKVAKKKVKSPANDKQKAVKISTTIFETHVDYIDKKVLSMMKKRGKSVNNSEALRAIIDEHRAAGL